MGRAERNHFLNFLLLRSLKMEPAGVLLHFLVLSNHSEVASTGSPVPCVCRPLFSWQQDSHQYTITLEGAGLGEGHKPCPSMKFPGLGDITKSAVFHSKIT